MSHSLLAKTSELVWALLESYDIDPLPLFREAHIDPKQMHDLSARISQSDADKLWTKVANAIDDPCFGLKAGKFWHPSYMHALGYAWLTSSTLRTALERLKRYIGIVNQSIEIKISEKSDLFSVTPVNTFRKEDRSWHEDSVASVILSMCRANYGDNLDPVSASFKHDKPTCAGDFFEFFRCPVEFGAKQTSLVFSRKDIDKRLSGENPLMSQVNDQVMIKFLATLNKDDIITQVKAAIIDQLPDGRMSDVKVAETLFMSNRKLQRKLQEEGTTFKTILTDIRKELALKYIQDSQLTLTELSFQLGFSEMSAFSRAFKQWTGESPRVYRQSI